MAELADDPRVAELLLLLWDAPDREAGIAIVDLPESLHNKVLLTACEGAQFIRFARRNHCWHGGGAHRALVLEPGWNVAELFKPGRKQVWDVFQEAIDEVVPEEIRHRVQLTYRGRYEASRLRLALGAPSRDLLSTNDVVYLVGVGMGRFQNVRTEERSKPDLPQPVIPGSGSRSAEYSYREIRPFLLRKWPKRAPYLPESFDQVQAILANRPQD